jgi:RNA-binding protein
LPSLKGQYPLDGTLTTALRSRTLPKSPSPRYTRTAKKKTAKKAVLRQTHKKTAKKTKTAEHKLLVLTGRQRTFLRGLAHDLNPVLQLGKAGATKALLDELGRALDAHELIKIRVLRECPEELDALIATIEKRLKANVVGKLGRILVIYRRNPAQQRIQLPVVKKQPEAKRTVEADAVDEFDDDEDDDLDDEDDDDTEL